MPWEQRDSSLASELASTSWGIVLAGGIGSRFWPLSSPERPKQLLSLLDERPLITHAIARLGPEIPVERILVLTSRDIAAAIHAAVPELPKHNLLVEPFPLGTAASLAWGAMEIRNRAGPEALVCVAHADLAISLSELFKQALSEASVAARVSDRIVLMGIAPSRADESFGYICPPTLPPWKGGGVAGDGEVSWQVGRFVEKPQADVAQNLIAAGALWHSGVFVAPVRVLEYELQTLTPEVATVTSLVQAGRIDDLPAGSRSISLERGLFERTSSLSAIRAEFTWDDVGTWASLRRARDLDDFGNGSVGAAFLVESSSNIVHSEEGTVVLFGVDNLLVVRRQGITFVTTIDRARDLRPLLNSLPTSVGGKAEG